jgi:hypothetical protein
MLLPPLDTDPIFIGGEPRSGTTLMRVLLDSHPAIACGPESQFFADPKFWEYREHVTSKWARRAEGFGYGASDLDDLFRDFVRGWFETYMKRQGKRRWADKTPQTLWVLPQVWSLFPKARFVHMIRDGRDVACSVIEQSWGPDNVKDAAERWVRSIECGLRWRGDPRYMEVRYEDLVADTEGQVRRVLDFVGEPFTPEVLEYYRKKHDWAAMNQKGAEQAAKPVYSDSIGRWRREMTEKQQKQFHKVAGPTLRMLGYAV